MDNQGYDFLNKIYQDLHLSDEVMHTAKPSDNKNKKIAKYMERLDRITRMAFDSKRVTRLNDIDILKRLYYDRYVITEDNVPDAYFELQKKIALDRGMGHLEYTEEVKKQEIEHIISEQKLSLDNWIEYFASPDTDNYPTWFKYYAFQGMVKLGTYDKERGSFNRRTSSTVKPFIELDREALAFVYDAIIKEMSKEEIDDEELEKLINNGSFGKLYGYALRKVSEVKKDISSDEGIWKKYPRGSNPEILYNDIHGKRTGWCTAGGLETAKRHVEGGDFYVYFTKGSNGEYSEPRIAIRKEESKIAEIRGIGSQQNLESGMEKVVEKKLEEKDFPDRDIYKRKVEDMQMLTYIYTKWQNKGELTKEDLRFLYEIDREIMGFGWQKDPRIGEILKVRNNKKDLSLVLDCDESKIATTEKELNDEIVWYFGDIHSNLGNNQKLQLPKYVIGNVFLKLTTTEDVKLPEYISGYLGLIGLKSAKGLKLPKHIRGGLGLNWLTKVEGLELPEELEGDLLLDSLAVAYGLKLPKKLNGSLSLCNLITGRDLELPEYIEKNLDLSNLKAICNLKLPKYVGGTLNLDSLRSAEGLELPEYIGGGLSLRILTSVRGVKFPKHVDFLFLNKLTTAKGLELPEHIDSILNLPSLTSFEGAILPRTKEGRDNLLNAVKRNSYNSRELVSSLEQEYQKHPLEELYGSYKDVKRKHKGQI